MNCTPVGGGCQRPPRRPDYPLGLAPQPLVVRARQHPIERGERFADAALAAEALAEREREPRLFAIGLGHGPSQARAGSPVTTLL